MQENVSELGKQYGIEEEMFVSEKWEKESPESSLEQRVQDGLPVQEEAVLH